MNTKQNFGGAWTVEKLDILSGYLNFYATALKNQPFDLIYIDAFAGTGHINLGSDTKGYVPGQIGIDMEVKEPEKEIIPGSATLALSAREPFSHYYFIEKNRKFATELETLIETDYPQRKSNVTIRKGEDCNAVLLDLCLQTIDWHNHRAVLFLDPYAADVKWETLQAVAKTGAIDVWYLFPFSAANRMMTKDGNIDPTWREKLNSIFGDDSWEQEFYEENPQISMFDTAAVQRNVSNYKLKVYIEKRLGTLFPKVSQHSRVLYNSKRSPLFMFCFAVSNPDYKAQGLALKVANYILQDKRIGLQQ